MKHLGMLMLTALCSAGCASTQPAAVDDDASRSGAVGVRDITGHVPVAARMELADNESFLMPLDEPDNAAPAYPEALLARRLPPQAVCLRVSIGADGKVMGTAPVSDGADCAADAVDTAFVDAATAAVADWRFEPALRCVFPSVAAKDNVQASCSGGEEIPVAVSLAYRFVFEQHDGRGVVRMGGR